MSLVEQIFCGSEIWTKIKGVSPETLSGTNEVFEDSVRPQSAAQRTNVDISDRIGGDVVLGDEQWRQKDWRERLR